MKSFILFISLVAPLFLSANTLSKVVAYDNCGIDGQQPHVSIKSGNYKYPASEIATKILPLDSDLRTIIYGDRKVGLTYGGLKPEAKYKLILRFISDHTNRVQRIKVGGAVSIAKVVLPQNKLITQDILIPAKAYKSGKLEILIETVEGLNCVLSDARLISDTPGLNSHMELVCGLSPGPTVEGKVIDLNSGQPIADALISLNTITTKSSKDGSFNISFKAPNKDVTLTATKGKLRATQLFHVKDFSVFRKPRLSQRPAKTEQISLNGTWKFLETLPTNFPKKLDQLTKEIKVPGEWVMQGFEVKKNTPAAFCRTFTVPSRMQGQRVKLRFDAVYSDCKVWVNGEKVGKHIGGFTPFELDITDVVKFGKQNTLALSVQNESLADTMANGSKYACHQLGGINRKVTLFSLPQANISSLAIETDLDKGFKNAKLNITLGITNDGKSDAKQKVTFYLFDPQGKPVALKSSTVDYGVISPEQETEKTTSFDIVNPDKWTNETPALYLLKMKLANGEVYSKMIGFKEVHVKGNIFYVNGKPIKLRGCNRHEVHPLTGRSLFGDLWEQDVKLFRDANINLIRTCHYPPAEELFEAADRLGIFVEVEAPFCFEWKGQKPERLELTVQQSMEMVVANRNYPSVLLWSVANECGWASNFKASSKAMRNLDPTRPQVWNTDHPHIQRHTEEYCELACTHYSGYRSKELAKNYSRRPIYIGEFAHLNAYNRLELASDRGLRDQWGMYFLKMWEQMYHEPTIVGGSIWSGIDDTFYLKNDKTVGYGTWGPIDGWRRTKPEYYHVKKVYSPIRILNQKQLKIENGIIVLDLENRQDFSNLNHLTINWKFGSKSGTLKPDIAPKSKGKVEVKVGSKKNQTLFLTFTDPRGFDVDHFALPIVPRGPRISNMRFYNCKIQQNPKTIEVKHGDVKFTIDKATGLFTSIQGKTTMKVNGPHLMMLPLNSTGSTQMTGKTLTPKPFTPICVGWKKESITVKGNTIIIKGEYKEAEGQFTYHFNGDGSLKISYDFTSKIKTNPRQLGLVFDLPKELKTLSWDRKGLWTTYPKDHIGRLIGKVTSTEGVEATSVGPKTKPSHAWRLDRGPAGSHDFASTKHNIYTASLLNNHAGLTTYANADRHIRAWIFKDHLRLLIAHYSNGGSERFLRRLSNIDDRKIEVGGKIKSDITLKFN